MLDYFFDYLLRRLHCLRRVRHVRCVHYLLAVCISCVIAPVFAEQNPTEALRAKYTSLTEQLRHNQFKRPLVLDSTETQNHLRGDIYAVVDYPFSTVSSGLNDPDHWCDVMHLHMNTKYCHAVTTANGAILKVNIGKKTPEELDTAARVEFKYSVAAATQDYIEITLKAKDGPMGTSDYRILLEAVPLPNTNKTFLHFTYSYSVGFSGRLAMNTYLATIGRNKVGFTVQGRTDDGKPEYIAGVRGLLERNTMRYYLAIDSFLGAANAAPNAQLEKRMENWYAAAESYPRQLHEIGREEYFEMKRAEYARQQTLR